MPDKYTKEAEKLLPRKRETKSKYDEDERQGYLVKNVETIGYNKAMNKATPIVADLLKQIDELKNIVEAYEDRE